jgi:5-methylthioribose kinase
MNISVDLSKSELQGYLEQLSWISNETISEVVSAGEGNMNVVLRITTDQRSFILKQSRPYVQKYPDIPAPIERIDVEAQFYHALSKSDVSQHLPSVMNYAPQEYLLMLSDLGAIVDMTSIYHAREIKDSYVEQLVRIAHQCHQSQDVAGFPENMELRKLNHQHIFLLPFDGDNGFSLDDVQVGLQELAKPYQGNIALKSVIAEMGEHYLSQGDVLVHGDYYPGSWMRSDEELYVLDPEFAHLGQAEFDLGVMTAHLIMATHDIDYRSKVIEAYPNEIDQLLLSRYAGIEIMRRLIGLAQLPISRILEEKKVLMGIALNLMQL